MGAGCGAEGEDEQGEDDGVEAGGDEWADEVDAVEGP